MKFYKSNGRGPKTSRPIRATTALVNGPAFVWSTAGGWVRKTATTSHLWQSIRRILFDFTRSRQYLKRIGAAPKVSLEKCLSSRRRGTNCCRGASVDTTQEIRREH